MTQGRISRTVYRFGSLAAGHFGDMVLRQDGHIGYYHNPNEAAFRFESRKLRFFDSTGRQTSTLDYGADSNVFLSNEGGGLYLLPIIELAERAADPAADAPLLVNTIPKSGTYLLEAACVSAGLHTTRLHMFANTCDDFRGLPDSEMHAAPEDHRRPAAPGAVAHILRPGELAVGHVADHAQLDAILQAGVSIVHCVRDLRHVLTSLYRFKRCVVRPVTPADRAWRALDSTSGFLAFLSFFADRDIAYVAQMATCILARQEPCLRFHELTSPADQDRVRARLQAWDEKRTNAFIAGLAASRFKPTPTLMHSLAPESVWSPAAEAFFVASGLARLNGLLGYEA